MEAPPRQPLVLIIMDGWGLRQDWAFNAVTRSGLETIPKLMQDYPWRPLRASAFFYDIFKLTYGIIRHSFDQGGNVRLNLL